MMAGKMMRGVAEASTRLKARVAGALYLTSVLAAVLGEFLMPGRLGIAAVVVPVSCYAAVMLLLYGIFKPVSRGLALLAVSTGLAGLAFEAFPWHPQGINVGMALHGVYCVLIGCLMLRSDFLPRLLGVPMALAGLCWLTNLWPALASRLYPGITAPGLLCEALPMLWLLALGVDAQQWREQARREQAE